MNYVLVIALFVQLVFIYICNGHNLLSVSFLSAVMFTLSAAVFAATSCWFDDYTVGLPTILTICGSIIFLFFGEMSVGKSSITVAGRSRKTKICNYDDGPKKYSKKLLALVCVSGVFIALMGMYNLFLYSLKYGNTEGILKAAAYSRVAKTQDTSNVTSIMSYLPFFLQAFSYIYVYIYAYNRIFFSKKNYLLLVPFLTYALYLVSTTERIGYIKIATIVIFIFAVMIKSKHNWSKNGNRKIIKIAILCFVVFILVFILLGIISERVSAASWFKSVGSYMGLSIMGLDLYIQDPWHNNQLFAQQTLYHLYYNLTQLGFNLPIEKSFLPFFYWKSVSSNIYTCLVKPLEDFRFVGLFVTRSLLGVFYGFLLNHVRKLKKESLDCFTIILFSMFMYPVILCGIADSFLFFLEIPNIYLIAILYIFTHGKLSLIKRGNE